MTVFHGGICKNNWRSKRMRVHIVPLISLGGNPTGDSNWTVFKNMALSIVKRGWTPTLWIPERAKEFYEKLPDIKGIQFKYFEASYDWYIETNRLPDELVRRYAKRSDKITDVCDLVVTSRAGAAWVGLGGMADFRMESGAVPSMIFEALVRDEKLACKIFPAIRANAYAHSHVWFLSEAEKTSALRMMRRFVSPALIKEAMEKRFLVRGIGAPTAKMDEYINKHKPGDEFTVFFGGRFSKEKRPDLMHEVMSKFYEFGRPVHCIVNTQHTGSVEMIKLEKKFSFTQFQAGCPQPEFFKNAATSHMFICTSENEGWPSGVWEQLYMSQIGIFPDKPWVRANLPEWYPFIFKNMTEAHVLIRYIYENYEEALEKVKDIREYIIAKESYQVISEEIMDWVEDIVQDEWDNTKVSKSLVEMIDGFLEVTELKEFTIQDAVNGVAKESRGLSSKRIANARFGSPSYYQIYVALQRMENIEEIAGTEITTFRRIDAPK